MLPFLWMNQEVPQPRPVPISVSEPATDFIGIAFQGLSVTHCMYFPIPPAFFALDGKRRNAIVLVIGV